MDDGLNDGWKQPTAGLNEPSAVRALRIDDVVATYVVDGVLVVWPAEQLPKVPAGTGRATRGCSTRTPGW
jgi:hypothetical protein